jgi:hypothetical protein
MAESPLSSQEAAAVVELDAHTSHDAHDAHDELDLYERAPSAPSTLSNPPAAPLAYEPTSAELRPHKLFEIQFWRERTNQYLDDTTFGFEPAIPPLTKEQLRDYPSATYHAIVGAVAGGLAGERIAFECSAALCAFSPDDNARMFLATQVIDEARHVEVFTHRLRMLGKEDLDATMRKYVNPRMFKFHDHMRSRVIDTRDFVGGVIGQNLALEGLALGFFEFNAALLQDVDPGTSHVLKTVLLDERRHVGFGLMRLRSLLEHQPDKRAYVEDTVGELSNEMMAIFEENADNMARLGVDPTGPMQKVRAYHEMHLAKLGILPA